MDMEQYAKDKEAKLSSLRDRILAARDITAEQVDVPEWDCVIEIRTPTVRMRGEIISEFMGNEGSIDYIRMYPSLIIGTAFDPDTGERIFTMADKDVLLERWSAVMERLGAVAVRLAGLDNAAERVELGKGGSSPTRNGDTSSD